MTHDLSGAILLVRDVHGINIPRWFATKYDPASWGICDADIEILQAGPDHDLYWDAWEDALRDARHHYDDRVWCLYQDGDLWAVPVE